MKKRLLPACLLLLASPASAHLGGVPTTAWLSAPEGIEVVDTSFTFGWTDYDDAADTDKTVIDFFYTETMPPTFRMGGQPQGLDGTAIVKGVPESDLTNEHTWDTSAVPAGTYFLFSIAHDPPFEMVAFSRGVVAVAHPGDPMPPAIVVSEPNGERDVASGGRFTIAWEALDPDGSGTVRLEAEEALGDPERIVVAEGLDPAAGSYEWVTEGLSPGDWRVRAVLEDERGLSHSAWGRFFVRVVPGGGSGGGSGTGGAGGADDPGAGGAGGEAGQGGAPGGDAGGDAGSSSGNGDGGGCSAGAGGVGLIGLGAALWWLLRARRQL